MKKQITETIEIPEGINCVYESQTLKCSKDGKSLERKITVPQVDVKIKDNAIILDCKRANKSVSKIVYSLVAHIKNIFHGLQEDFVYQMESANVHFPMTIKIEGDSLIINNFLGEKVPRKAKIKSGVEVKIEGNKITVSSPDREAAVQTAANIEKATRVGNRDRRIFQDGVYITQKPIRDFKEATQ